MLYDAKYTIDILKVLEVFFKMISYDLGCQLSCNTKYDIKLYPKSQKIIPPPFYCALPFWKQVDRSSRFVNHRKSGKGSDAVGTSISTP